MSTVTCQGNLDMDQPIHNIPLLASNVPMDTAHRSISCSRSPLEILLVIGAPEGCRRSTVCQLEARVPVDTCLSAATLGFVSHARCSRSHPLQTLCVCVIFRPPTDASLYFMPFRPPRPCRCDALLLSTVPFLEPSQYTTKHLQAQCTPNP